MTDHVAIIEPDDRKRFPLGRFITREPVDGWKVFRSPDGHKITLEAIPIQATSSPELHKEQA